MTPETKRGTCEGCAIEGGMVSKCIGLGWLCARCAAECPCPLCTEGS